MTERRDSYGWLTVADLQLVARARGVSLPADTDRDAIVAALQSHDRHPSAQSALDSTTATPNPASLTVLSERSGWWTSLSVSTLRNLARQHSLDVPAGMHRRELVALLIEHKVPRPPGTTSGRRRRSR